MSFLQVFHESSRWVLALLLLVPLLWWRVYLRRHPTAVRFSSTESLQRLGGTWRVRLRWLPPALRTAALVLLIVALARPRKGGSTYSQSQQRHSKVDEALARLAIEATESDSPREAAGRLE